MYHRYVGTRPVDSLDITLDEDLPLPSDLPFDRVRTSYDVVAANYANELADEIVAKPIERGMLLAFADLVQSGVVGDVGCGPGHIAKHLATTYGVTTIGYDISHQMIEQAHAKFPAGEFHVGSIFDLPVGNAAWRGAVARYTLLHSTPDERVRAFRELARVIAPDGYLLYCFYVSAPDHPEGSVYHLTSWFGHAVDLDVHFIGVEDAADEIDRCGFSVEAVLLREPMQKNELPTRRCYMLAHRR